MLNPSKSQRTVFEELRTPQTGQAAAWDHHDREGSGRKAEEEQFPYSSSCCFQQEDKLVDLTDNEEATVIDLTTDNEEIKVIEVIDLD